MIGPSCLGVRRQRAVVLVGLRLLARDATKALTTDKDRRLLLSFGVSQSMFSKSVLLAEVSWYLIRHAGDVAAAPNYLDFVDPGLLRTVSPAAATLNL